MTKNTLLKLPILILTTFSIVACNETTHTKEIIYIENPIQTTYLEEEAFNKQSPEEPVVESPVQDTPPEITYEEVTPSPEVIIPTQPISTPTFTYKEDTYGSVQIISQNIPYNDNILEAKITKSGEVVLLTDYFTGYIENITNLKIDVSYKYTPFVEVYMKDYSGEKVCARYSTFTQSFGSVKPVCLWSSVREDIPLEDFKNAYFGYEVLGMGVYLSGVEGEKVVIEEWVVDNNQY